MRIAMDVLENKSRLANLLEVAALLLTKSVRPKKDPYEPRSSTRKVAGQS